MYDILLNSWGTMRSVNQNRLRYHVVSSVKHLMISSGYSAFWNQSDQYLAYLLQERLSEPLTDIERQNLRLIVEHASVITSHLQPMKELVLKKDLDDLRENGDIDSALKKMIHEIEQLPNIGEEDSVYPGNRSQVHGPIDIFQGEEIYSIEKLAARVKKFMEELWRKENQQDVLSVGGGDNLHFGESLNFNKQQNRTLTSAYQVTITKKGGHILRLDFDESVGINQDRLFGPMKTEYAFEIAKQMINKWGEEPLELFETEQNLNHVTFTFVPVRDGVPLVNRKVIITVQLDKGFVQFNAHRYFSHYKTKPPLKPLLSKEQAVDELTDTVTVSGDVTLEVRQGKTGSDVLVYRIPVKGITNVSVVFINAVNGNYEGIR